MDVLAERGKYESNFHSNPKERHQISNVKVKVWTEMFSPERIRLYGTYIPDKKAIICFNQKLQ